MATISFVQRFYVGKEKEDEFVAAITAPPNKEKQKEFASRAMSKEQLKQYVKEGGSQWFIRSEQIGQ